MSDSEKSGAESGGEEQKAPAAPAEEKKQNYTIHVGNLSYSTTEDGLKKAFSEYGQVLSCRIPQKPNGNSKGYGFIETDSKESLDTMIEKLNGTDLDGRTIKVEVSHPEHRPQSRSRSSYRERDRRDYRDDRDRDRHSSRDRRYRSPSRERSRHYDDDYDSPPRRSRDYDRSPPHRRERRQNY